MDLRQNIGQKLIQEFQLISEKNPSIKYKLLVLDALANSITNVCLDMNALSDTGVYLVENLSMKRQAYSYIDAVYFVAPVESSIQAIIDDFSTKKRYRSAHILLTAHLPDTLFQMLSDARVSGYIGTLKELYVEFLALEPRGFQLEVNPEIDQLAAPGQAETKTDLIAERLAYLCISIDEDPVIRYTLSASTAAKKISQQLQQNLQRYKDANKLFGAQSRSTIVILDRAVDCVSPLLHEFTYQAMIQDLVPLEQGNRYKYKDKTAVLDDDDEMWCQLRHKHISECREELSDAMKKFQTENKVAQQMAQKGKQPETTAKEKSFDEMKEMIAGLPKYNEMKNAFALHFSLLSDCIKAFEAKKLKERALLEQDMAASLDAEDRKQKIDVEALQAAVADVSAAAEDKARWILLYALTQADASDTAIDALCKKASLDPATEAAIKKQQAYTEQTQQIRRAVWKARERKDDGGVFGLFGSKNKEETDELSRYETLSKGIFDVYQNNALDDKAFPYYDPRQANRVMPEEHPQSLRKTKTGKKKESSNKIILFVVGGVSYSELRDAYLMSEKADVDCLIGGVEMQRPDVFLHKL